MCCPLSFIFAREKNIFLYEKHEGGIVMDFGTILAVIGAFAITVWFIKFLNKIDK